MIYTALDNFYLTDEQLKNSPSRKDGTDEATETSLRVYGCDLIQESGILLGLPQAVMASGQVLFHRFYCKKSFASFDVKLVAVSCVWLASQLEECPRRTRQVIVVFHRMECRRENLRVEFLGFCSSKYSKLKKDLIMAEIYILREMGFICHVEHPHKFISNYIAILGLTPPELRQEAWNLANDNLRTTLCVRVKSEVVACGVVYAAARRFQVPLPENPPWWKVFDAEKSEIDEVWRVLTHLYSLPKAHYCKDGVSYSFSSKLWDSQSAPTAVKAQSAGSKVALLKVDKLKYSKKRYDESKTVEAAGDKSKDRERHRVRAWSHDRGRDSDRKRKQEEIERDSDNAKYGGRTSKDRGNYSGRRSKKSRHHALRESDYHSSSYSSRDKDCHRR